MRKRTELAAVLAALFITTGGAATAAPPPKERQFTKLAAIGIGERATAHLTAVSPDGRLVAILYAGQGGGKNEILVCEAATGKELATLADASPGRNASDGGGSPGEPFAFTPDSKYLALGWQGQLPFCTAI